MKTPVAGSAHGLFRSSASLTAAERNNNSAQKLFKLRSALANPRGSGPARCKISLEVKAPHCGSSQGQYVCLTDRPSLPLEK